MGGGAGGVYLQYLLKGSKSLQSSIFDPVEYSKLLFFFFKFKHV